MIIVLMFLVINEARLLGSIKEYNASLNSPFLFLIYVNIPYPCYMLGGQMIRALFRT